MATQEDGMSINLC